MTWMGGVELLAQPTGERKLDAPVSGPKINVGLIGLGPWGREILSELGRLPQAEVAAICDSYPTMLRRSASKAPGAALVENYQAILANQEIQAVIVATGTHQHKAIVIAALQAGKHVYCEAPLAHTMADAREIALAARAARLQVFQPGLTGRSDPQRQFLYPFVRSGALGKTVMARAQWHKKDSWRQASPNPEREQAVNWRLRRATSPGLIGELGIHALDQACWMLNRKPTAVTGFGATRFWNDGRDVPDTVEAVLEFPEGVRMNYHAALTTSFDAESEFLYGTDATIMMRDGKAWMFKEVDAALLGWEVYARKDNFYKETGIVLMAGASKQQAAPETPEEAATPAALPALHHALVAFLGNSAEVSTAGADFKASYETADDTAAAEYLAALKLRPAATYREGFFATVLALMANEAINTNQRIELKPEWFELA
jgi:predicted dehydrogenase